MRHIDYGLGVVPQRARSTRIPRRARSTSPTVYQRLLAARRARRLRSARAVLRNRLAGGLEETRAPSGERSDSSRIDHELRPTAPRRSRADHRSSSTPTAIERIGATLARSVRARGGRLFFLGVGGSAGNCSHAVNDFRKIAGIEAYAPTDNVSELTARTNDEGWDTVFVDWLKGSRLRSARRALRPLGRRRQASRRTSARTSCARCSTPSESVRRSSASSAATAATRRRSPTRASSSRR